MSMPDETMRQITAGCPVRAEGDGDDDWLASVTRVRKVRAGLRVADVVAIETAAGHRPGEIVTGLPLRSLTAITSRQLYIQAQCTAVMHAVRAHASEHLEAVLDHMQREGLELFTCDGKTAPPRLAAVPAPRHGEHEAAAERILERERVDHGTALLGHGLLAVAEAVTALREQLTGDIDAAAWMLAERIAEPGDCLAGRADGLAEPPLYRPAWWDAWAVWLGSLWHRARGI